MRAPTIAIFLLVIALPVSGEKKFGTCNPIDVGVFRERVHIRCATQLDGITFFAVPTSDADYAKSFLNVASIAASSNRRLVVLYDPADTTSGPRFGCLANDCRPALAVFLDGPQPEPFDLVWDQIDVNNIPLNPIWGWQSTNGEPPDYTKVCKFVSLTTPVPLTMVFWPSCTQDRVAFDTGPGCSSQAHVNWSAATYEGPLRWAGHSGPLEDDDYNIFLFPPGGAGLTARSGGSLLLEFDSDETIDHFRTPWWRSLHEAVDKSDEPNSFAKAMIDNRFGIVTGVVGLDCDDGRCRTEIHPVWALAVRVKPDPEDEIWAIFVRNWGNEGWCSNTQWKINLMSYTFRLPWRSGATGVTVSRGTQFLTNDRQATGPNVSVIAAEPVSVNFTFSAPGPGPRLLVPLIEGEIHLKWSGARIEPVPTPVNLPISLAPSPEKQEGTEKRFHTVVSKLTPEQRNRFIKRLRQNKMTSYLMVPKRIEVPYVYRATEVRAATSGLPNRVTAPELRSAPNANKRKKDRLTAEILRTVFGRKLPKDYSDILKGINPSKD
jgi:hypothetical protein